MKAVRPYLLPLLCITALLSCTADVQIDIYLVRSPDVDEDPLVPGLTSDVRMRITGPGMNPIEVVSPYVPGGTAKMPKVPLGKDRVITVEGLKADGLVLSRGRSLPLPINEDTAGVPLLIARVGRFSYTPDNGLAVGRFGHAAAVADTGELVIAGGATDSTYDTSESASETVEIYNPTDGSVRRLPCGDDCGAAPGISGNMLPLNGGLLMLSGRGQDPPAAAFLDPVGETDTPVSIPVAERYGAAGVSTDNRIVLAGGTSPEGPTDLVEIIDAEYNVQTVSLTDARWGLAGAGTPSGAVFFGGFDADGNVSADLFFVPSDSAEVQRAATGLDARAFARAVTLSDGRVLLIGGETQEGVSSESIDLVDPVQSFACRVGTLKTGVRHTAAALLSDGRVLTVGGMAGGLSGTPVATAVILDPRYIELSEDCTENSGTLFTTDIPPAGTARYLAEARNLKNGTVALVGGLTAAGTAVRQIEIFVPEE